MTMINSYRRRQRGVTLMELLTVVVVLGILATIAIPSYRSYLLRSQRTDGTTTLLRVRSAQEKFYLQNNAYSNDMGPAPAGLGIAGAAGACANSEGGKYQVCIAFNGGNPNTFIATAAPTAAGGQGADTKCTSFTINETGTKGSTGTATTAECWR
ncbi:MAG: type IV pilin protein [Steroidobacteraceae bacterium]